MKMLSLINEKKIALNNFSCLSNEVAYKREHTRKTSLCEFVVQTVTNKKHHLVSSRSSSLQINNKGKEPIMINFTDRFFYAPAKIDLFQGTIPFYLSLTQLHKTFTSTNPNCSINDNSTSIYSSTTNSTNSSSVSASSSSKYSYIEIYLEMYNSADEKLGQSLITPNTNILLDAEYFSQKENNSSEISYFKLSIVIKEPCKINLNYFKFGFSDFMSTDTFYSKKFDVTVRLQVNNLKKKKNGVVIFFPSFYIKERDTDSINNNANSVKWPNFTRYTWSRDLENICTIFVADPFQFSNGNERSSWFIAPNGESIIPEIASYIKSILDIKEIHEPSNENSFSLLDIHDMPTPKNENFFSLFSTSHKCGPIINYGSSMGGYAAFLFSCHLTPDLCFCECPQANLMKYKYSKEYLDTCDGLGLKELTSTLSNLPPNDRAKQKTLLENNIVQKYDLSFSAILRNHHPKFRSLIHFYSLDKLHLTSFENEIHSLTDEELKTFNYQLVIENDIENELFTHQAMPKDKVLEIFRTYLSKNRK